ncbi:MAG: ABC transporter permease [Actinomycetes bacterium]|jgi:ABC-2 type transport system permease protein|nr:MAG: multidrug ABC transporter permease [Actinomycetota bacterium]
MTTVFRDTWWLTRRRLAIFLNQPGYLVVTLIQPAVWLFLFGNLFRRVVELPGFGVDNYLDYLVPGVLVMNALASSIWAGMGMLEEIERGTMNRLLTLPISRTAIMSAGLGEHAVASIVQSGIILGMGALGGATYPGGIVGMVILVASAILLGTAVASLSNALGMVAGERETIIGVNSFLLLPTTFLSSVFMAKDLMPGWIATVARFNPLDWAAQMGRSALSASPDWGLIATRGALLVVIAALALMVSVRTFRTYQRQV